MKRLKRFFYTFLSMCLLLGMTLPVSAKEEEYTYTVRFFAGQQGSFATGEMVEFTGLHYGTRINFYQNAVTLNDNSKYYVRGIRESGKDNSDSTQANSFVVTGDMDYVVAYGILGDATSYTINYRDSAGNALAPSETYYGNVGDRPVVAYIYIEGWTPEAYNMTQTLQKDPAENVFTFIYTRNVEEQPAPQPPAPEPELAAPTPEPAPAPQPPAPEPAVPAVPGFEVIEDPELPTAPGPDGAGDAQDAQTPGGDGDEQNIPDEETPTDDGPQEIVDMDEQEVPTANFLQIAAEARLLGIPVPVVIILALGAVGAAWYFLFMRKKKAEEKKEEES